MAHNNDPMASTQAEGFQGNPPRVIPNESYYLQIQNFLNFTLHESFELQQSHSALEAWVISMQRNTKKPDERRGEPSFVVKPFIGEKNERTEETICTWLSRWEFHFELCPKPDSTKIAYVGRELGGKAVAWYCGVHTMGNCMILGQTLSQFSRVN